MHSCFSKIEQFFIRDDDRYEESMEEELDNDEGGDIKFSDNDKHLNMDDIDNLYKSNPKIRRKKYGSKNF